MKPIMKCTENGEHSPEIDIDLYDGFSGCPSIAISLPDDCWPEDYTGAGVFEVPLEDVLKLYLDRYYDFNHGKTTIVTVNMLREYANKVESALLDRMKLVK